MSTNISKRRATLSPTCKISKRRKFASGCYSCGAQLRNYPNASGIPQDARDGSYDAVRALAATTAAVALGNTNYKLRTSTKSEEGNPSYEAASSGQTSEDRPKRRRWTRKEIKVAVAHAKALKPRGKLHIDLFPEKLGWDRDSAARARTKIWAARVLLERGEHLFPGKPLYRAEPGTYSWREWLQRALAARPNNEATANEIAAYLEADPVISRKLDRRIVPVSRTMPRWRSSIYVWLAQKPCFVNTGRKRNDRVIYRYVPQGKEAAEKARTNQMARQCGKKDMVPHLGGASN